jgi:peptide deformylase
MLRKEDIITLPNNDLRKKSQSITNVKDGEVVGLINDMLTAVIDWENSREHEVAVGLAAVQIDRLFRVVLVREDFDDYRNKNFFVMINPEIVKLEGLPVIESEGCLSVKNMYGKVARYPKVKFKYLDVDGDVVERTAKGFFARVIQHEIDHLDGTLYTDRVADPENSFFRLTSSGDMVKLNYDEIEKDNILR